MLLTLAVCLFFEAGARFTPRRGVIAGAAALPLLMNEAVKEPPPKPTPSPEVMIAGPAAAAASI